MFTLIDKELPILDKKFKTIDFRNNGFSNEERILNKIIFENCRFDYLDLGFVTFENSVTFKHCVIKNGFFHSVHFKGDLIIENCIFEKETDFSCGEIYSSFTLLKTTFNEYVDFFDTFFNGKSEIVDCKFRQGTNLLSWRGAFKANPTIIGNIGNLDVDLNK